MQFFIHLLTSVKIHLTIQIGSESFLINGKIPQKKGWKAVTSILQDDIVDETLFEKNLLQYKKGDTLAVENVRLHPKQTTPPNRYTEATLLTAMESPGKFIEDEELRDSIKVGGLGTPATRCRYN